MVMDSSRQSAIASIERVSNLLQGYSGRVGALRMQARGIDPSLLSALSIESNDVATPETQTIIFLNMLPFMLIMTIFMGGMYVIIDTTAGERERGSLEPLLINPVPRSQMVMGKLLASLPFALATLALTLALLFAAFKLIPFEEFIGMPMQLSFGSLWNIFLLSIPLLLFASALQMLVASFTRSFKEAQTYLGFLPLVAGLPSIFLAFLSVKNNAVNMMIPAYSQSLLMNQVLRSETIRMPDVMISTIATLLLSALLIALSVRLYQREQILFGR
jgi:sodium transport system permease protein